MTIDDIHALVAYLDTRPADGAWEWWRICRIEGGRNNLIYRATGSEHDLAIKFCRRDDRDRAGREYAALRLVHTRHPAIAPEPLLLERERYRNPVVVQTWLAGEVSAAPPAADNDWRAMLAHYAALRQFTPASSAIPLRPAVTNMDSFANGQAMVAAQAALLPDSEIDAELRMLLRQVARLADPQLPPATHALCRVDANCANFIRRPGVWASVDWENSGWGDPAFEIVDLMTHAALIDVPDERWEWVIAEYARLTGDRAAPARIRAYYPLMLVWWVVRLARYLYEVPRGLDQALVERAPSWEHDLRAKYARYLRRAQTEVAGIQHGAF